MTEKENYLKLLRGEQPDWVPRYTFISNGGPTPTAMVGCSVLRGDPPADPMAESVDCWGVTHVPVPSAGGARIPKPGEFILKDICDWRDVIKLPDISEFDFEADAKKQLSRIDREQTAVMFDLNCGFFQLLMEFMGFTEGLCAMYEEPDEVKALMEYISNFVYEVNSKIVDYFQPDVFALVDDTATWQNPFISVNTYRELIKPFHQQQANLAIERGKGVDMHNCGHCEAFIEDWFDLGVVSWNPAQTCNDLLGIKKRYGNKLILEGCWEARGRLIEEDCTEQEVKDAVRRTIETYAPGGGYMFMGSFLGAKDDPVIIRKNRWVEEAYEEYGRTFYKK